MATTKSVGEQIAEYKAKIKELEDKHLDELQAKKADLEKQLEAVQSDIDAILPPMKHPAAGGAKRGPKAAKSAGKQVSADSLASILKENNGSISIRKHGHDLKHIKHLVSTHPDKFAITGGGPWPVVSSVKK